jgi:type IV pilus assembly protein PilA
MFKGNENGYTLLELMIVILIIGILVALAIVTYAGVSNSGYDTEAKVNLRHGVVAAVAYYTENKTSYDGMDALALSKIAVGVNFREGVVGTDNDVYITSVSASGFSLSCRSRSGNTYTATGQETKIKYNF